MGIMENKKWFTLKTKAGCWRLLALFLAIILVSSFFGRLIQTDVGTVKVEQVTFDARGAEMYAELYYPAGTSTKDSLPAVVVSHGGGCNSGIIKGIAVELARRGFVVLLEDAYGAGLSTMPGTDATGNGEDGFNFMMTECGVYDAIQFVKSLKFVDTARIGLIGHSTGAGRTANAAILECGYYSFNDIMINILYDTFGQRFTQDEISLDADILAAERLNADQLAHYYVLRDTQKAEYDSKAKSVILLGIGLFGAYNNAATISVGGYDVERGIQANLAFFWGRLDADGVTASTNEADKAAWYSAEDIVSGTWYNLNTTSKTSETIGTLFGSSIVSDSSLQSAIDGRTSRIFYVTNSKITHAKELLSNEVNTSVVKYFEQTLNYNRGNLTDSATQPLDSSSNIWYWQGVFNLVSLLALVGLLISAGGILFAAGAFRSCVFEAPAEGALKFSKKRYGLFAAATIVIGFLSIYIANNNSISIKNGFWPSTIPWSTVVLIACQAIGTLLLLGVLAFIAKKDSGHTGLKALNLGISFKNIMKTIAATLILLGIAYGSLQLIEYFFGQDYRFWLTTLTQMKADGWCYAFNYGIVLFPCFLIFSLGINYTIRREIPQWKDTLNTVLINSAGIWLCCIVNYIITAAFFQGSSAGGPSKFFASFSLTYGVLIWVPVTIYISRKMYHLTKSIWAGALLNTMIIAWSLASTIGYNDLYTAQTWLGNFLNF
jgi:hypothetical protein